MSSSDSEVDFIGPPVPQNFIDNIAGKNTAKKQETKSNANVNSGSHDDDNNDDGDDDDLIGPPIPKDFLQNEENKISEMKISNSQKILSLIHI